MDIRLAQKHLQQDSVVDGTGIRAVLWTQGCPHNCEGCHNPETHDFNAGIVVDIENIKREIDELKTHDGITFSGGDPMCQPEACMEIAKYAKEKGYNVWCYTGYLYEHLNSKQLAFIDYIDVLVDGKFELAQRSLNLRFKGSKNQRVIDIPKSKLNGSVTILEGFEGIKTYNPIYSKPEGIF